MTPTPHASKISVAALVVALAIPSPAAGASSRWASGVLSATSEFSATSWSAAQVLGPPDAWPAYGDIPSAWAPGTADGQREAIELEFGSAAPINFVAVFETLNPGAIDSVYAWNPGSGGYELLWSGAAHTAGDSSRVWAATFPTTSFAVSRLRISLDSPGVTGWNEIDAVAIGVDAIHMFVPQWASSAQASSAYHPTGGFSPASATGPPDVYPGYGDNGNAWASLTADGGREWLQLDYARPVFVSGYRVYETFSPGAIDSIYLRNADDGSLHVVYAAAPAALPAIARILGDTLAVTTYPVDGVRLTLASNAVSTWNEIDAVALDVDSLLIPAPPVGAVPSPATVRTIALAAAHPSPFSVTTDLSYTLQWAGPARLAVYDVRGARVRMLASGEFAAGPHTARWDGHDDAGHAALPGVYFLRLEAGGGAVVRRVVRLQ